MGEVYHATGSRLQWEVAIKVVADQFTERFEREARAVAALNHPNICTLHDFGPNYLIMEHVDGSPVAPQSELRKLLDLAAQIADGIGGGAQLRLSAPRPQAGQHPGESPVHVAATGSPRAEPGHVAF